MSEQTKKYDAICIGQIVQDILVTNIPEDALTCGEPTIDADQILMAGGGDAINEAATLSRLGNNVALLGRLDQGDVGNMICGDLDRCGINKDLLIRPEDCQSVSVIVVVKPNGEHSFFLGKGENDALQRADIVPGGQSCSGGKPVHSGRAGHQRHCGNFPGGQGGGSHHCGGYDLRFQEAGPPRL